MALGVAIPALWIWLLPVLVSGGVFRRQAEEFEDVCVTYFLNSRLHLDCSNRGLRDLPEELDDKSRQAEVVLLSNNNFGTFPKQLEHFSQVEVLDLSGNGLNRPLPEYIQSWTNLNTLNLSNNLFESWSTSGSHYDIKILDLSKNKVNATDERAFSAMPSLHFLDLSENKISNLPATAFTEVWGLDTLILNRNFLSEVPKFQTSSLRSLFLSSCQITDIEVVSLLGMSSLIELDISLNLIDAIPNNLASNTLQELNLSYNKINSLTDNSFSSLPHLAVLDLRGNEFSEVWSTSHFSSNPFLREVYVKGNRWSCEGFSVNLLLTYEFLTKEPPKIADRESLICYSPANVTQLSWQQAYIQTWHGSDSATSSYTSLAVMIGIIIGVVVTSCVCRGIVAASRPDSPPRSTPERTVLNLNGTVTQPRQDSVVMRITLRDDLPPSYDEALLMPRLNSSFHSLPDFVDDDEETRRRQRRSRSFGDLTEFSPRVGGRRSMRRPMDIDNRETIRE